MPEKGQDYVSTVIDISFIVSFISYIEFLGYNGVSESMKGFIALADVIEINKAIINETILIRKSRRIKLPDAVIAATALVHDFALVSRNIKDFESIKGLKLINPYFL